MTVKLVCTESLSTLYCTVTVDPYVRLCTLVMFRVLVLLTVYTPRSFCSVFIGHAYSALSHAGFTVSMSHHNVLIWCFTEGEDHTQVVLSGCIIQSG